MIGRTFEKTGLPDTKGKNLDVAKLFKFSNIKTD